MSKVIWTIVIILLLIVGGYYFLRQGMQNSTVDQGTVTTTSTENGEVSTSSTESTGTEATSSQENNETSTASTTKSTTTKPVVASKSNVVIKNFAFTPQVLIIKAGTYVVWTNKDSVAHQIKSSMFNSSLLNPGDSYQYRFKQKGNFNYSCAIHPSMTGTIIVQ